MRHKIKGVQGELSELDARKNELTEQLEELDREYGRLAKSVRETELKARSQDLKLTELALRRGRIREQVLQQNRALTGQIRAAYSMGREDWLKCLISQEDPARFGRVLSYYGYVNRSRLTQLQRLQQDLVQARVIESEILTESKELDATRTAMHDQDVKLAATRHERRELLVRLEHELLDKNTQLLHLQEDAQRLQSLISGMGTDVETHRVQGGEGKSLVESRGRLAWPVKGPLRAQFGSPRQSGRWDGVLIGAPEGAPVHAVASGRVAFSDWLRGYGLLTIVDHGDGYMSLYAFNQSLYKNVGEWVSAGEVVAEVGASGGQSEPGLYFGMREKGRPINPLAWCEHSLN